MNFSKNLKTILACGNPMSEQKLLRNLLLPPTLIAYILKITLNFFKQFKMSDSPDNTL